MNRATKAFLVGGLVCLAGSLTLAPNASAQGPQTKQTQLSKVYETREGRGILTLNLREMELIGLQLVDRTGRFEGLDEVQLGLELPRTSALELARLDRSFGVFTDGSTPLGGRLALTGPGENRFVVSNATLSAEEDSAGAVWTLTSRGVEALRFVSSSLVEMDYANERLRWEGVDVLLGKGLAEALNIASAEGTRLGTLALEAAMEPTDRTVGEEAIETHPANENGTLEQLGNVGPDVIVGSLPDTRNWGQSGSIRAYSVGTTSCNIGDENLEWIANNNRHPVIGQNLYRLKNGRFEMIGQSWLKHGFFALSGSLCFNDCNGTDGSELGVHCSDPYSAGLNGGQSGLGPKFEVNATTGVFPYPFSGGSGGTTGRRLQVNVADIDPAQNAGALYFVEGHYVTPDDAAAGNGLNNASYRRVAFSSGSLNMNLQGSTFQQQPAINAWAANESGVTTANLDIPGDGRFHVSSKATDLGGGTWHYEYAVHNLNSHRSGQAFSVRFPPGANISNVSFSDIAYHSGEPFSNTDWQATIGVDSVTWAGQTFAQNQNANALRWSTMYNFRFDCDCPPFIGEATLTAFRPGTDTEFPVAVEAPMVDPPEPMPDLALQAMFVDYDPATAPVNNGPGAIGQAIDILVRVRNVGNVPVTSADVSLVTNVAGGSVINKNIVVSDFSADAGVQALPRNKNFDVVFSFAAGELDRCGTYTLIASHDGANLTASTSGGSIMGDINTANDEREDYPTEEANPNDDQSPDLLELRFGTINSNVLAESVVIENKATERLKLNINYTGLGPGGDSHDVALNIDLMNPAGSTVLHPNIFSIARMNVRSNGSKTVVLRVPVGSIPAGEYRVRMTLSDTNSNEGCLTSSTGNTTTIQ